MNFIIGLVVIGLVILMFKNKPILANDWHQFLDNQHLSGKEFYEKIVEGLKQRQFPGLNWKLVTEHTNAIMSDRREYLQISRGEYVFFICAAPFGTGYYISWHLGIREQTLIEKIPLLNTLLGKNRKTKTFYQKDTEAMFRSMVHAVVSETLAGMQNEKGVRLNPVDQSN